MQIMNKSMSKLFIALFVFAACLPFLSNAQELSKNEKDADMYVQYQNFDKAADLYNSALNKASGTETRNRINLKLATMYFNIRKYSEAARSYDVVYLNNLNALSKKQAADYISSLIRTNQVKRAAEIVKSYTETKAYSKDVQLLNLERGIQYLDNPAEGVNIIKAPFSKDGSSFWCANYDNGILFLNTGTSEKERLKGARFYLYNGSQTKEFDKVQETLQAGPATFSSDRSTMLYTDNRYGDKAPTKMKNEKVVNNNLMIVELKYNSKKQSWDSPTELFKDKTDYSFCHPSLSKDGNVLYFASNMNPNRGMDLFMSRRSGNGWSDPVNLGDIVNTAGDEVFPYVHGEYLIFSSNEQEGFGGQDIYAVLLSANGLPVAGTLQHLPAPINGVYNDYALMNVDETTGYFTSDRPDGANLDAIYTWDQDMKVTDNIFKYRDEAPRVAAAPKPEPEPIVVPKPEPVKTIEPPKVVEPVVVQPTPEPIPPYTGKTGSEVADDLANESYLPDVTVYFDFAKFSLSSAGKAALSDFCSKYKKNKAKIIVVGYTDIIGTNEANLTLSLKRASAVKQYLMSQGVDASVIEMHGRGKLILLEDEELTGASLQERLAPARKTEVKILQ